MKNDVRDKEDSLQRLDKKHKELEQKFQESVSSAEVFRSKLHSFQTNLPAVISQLYQYRSTLHDLRQQVQNHQMFFKTQHGELNGAITTISSKYAAGKSASFSKVPKTCNFFCFSKSFMLKLYHRLYSDFKSLHSFRYRTIPRKD